MKPLAIAKIRKIQRKARLVVDWPKTADRPFEMYSDLLVERISFAHLRANELAGFIGKFLQGPRSYLKIKMADHALGKKLCSRKRIRSRWRFRKTFASCAPANASEEEATHPMQT